MEKTTSPAIGPSADDAEDISNQTKDNSLTQKTSREEEYITGFKLASVIVSVTLVAFLIMLDTSIIATAIPRITTDFNSLDDVGWYGAAYLLASASLQPLTGRLYTIFDSKWTFLTFFGIFELGSLLCGVANSSDMLIVGRAVAGMGTAGLSNGALTIIAAVVPLQKRPMYLGFMMSTAQIGIILGPLVGGLLTQYATWRWCFYINLPPGAIVAVLLFLIRIPDLKAKDDGIKATVASTANKLDLLGFVFFAPSAIQFLLALEWGGSRYPWNDAKVIGLFCGAAGTFVIFLVLEYRKGDEAMIPFPMLRQRIIACSCLAMLFFGGSMYVLTFYLPIYFQAVRDATPTMSGVYLLPSVLTQILFAMTSGILVGRLGYYLPWAVASGLLVSIANGLLSTLTTRSSTGKWIGYQIIGGAGRGCGLQMASPNPNSHPLPPLTPSPLGNRRYPKRAPPRKSPRRHVRRDLLPNARRSPLPLLRANRLQQRPHQNDGLFCSGRRSPDCHRRRGFRCERCGHGGAVAGGAGRVQ
jgi:MFS family permease